MAEYLASIFGTEKDKVNCSFYFKIGACRHGDRCSRIHNKPNFSQTILIQNLYHNPQNMPLGPDGQPIGPPPIGDEEAQEHFDDFFEDVFVELEDKYGEIEEMNVCDNLGDHLIGNVYIKFRREEDAEKAVADLNNRWFNGRPVYAELSPVTDFREACCRQYEQGECTRSGFCNFMHLKPISKGLHYDLYGRKRRERSASPVRGWRRRSRSFDRRRRSRSRDVKKRRSRSRSKESRKRTTTERRSKSRERKHRPVEERDKDKDKEKSKERERHRDRNRDRDREKRDRRENANDRDQNESKLTEQERIQCEIDANMNELFANQGSNSYQNGDRLKAAPSADFEDKEDQSNPESNSMLFDQLESNAAFIPTDNTDSSQNGE